MRYIKIFGIKFLDGTIAEIIKKIESGGIISVPAAPALVKINTDIEYHKSLKESRFAIFDSGFLCILLLILKGIKVKKISGLQLLNEFLNNIHKYSSGQIFLIDPSKSESISNKKLLKKFRHHIAKDCQYVAPMYGESLLFNDKKLLSAIKKNNPKIIIINLAGGLQEKIALYIYKNYFPKNRPSIILCTGAAIAFLTGHQAKIPNIIDKVYLGWLIRCLFNPTKFIPRYLKAFNLIKMIYKHKVTVHTLKQPHISQSTLVISHPKNIFPQ